MTMRRMTKKAMALVLHAEGATVEEIARQLDTRPSYVANVLAAAGQRPAYHDLYVSTVIQSGYTQRERGLLRFQDVHAAQQSVHRLDTLYHACEHQHDRRGQHQAQLLALIGKNRAEGLGKYAEAQVFAKWLQRHLTVQRPALEGPSPVPADCHHASQTRMSPPVKPSAQPASRQVSSRAHPARLRCRRVALQPGTLFPSHDLCEGAWLSYCPCFAVPN